MAEVDMGAFWDSRARENAAFFVENRLDYGDTDLERFWETGPEIVDTVLGQLDIALTPADDVVELGCGIGRLTRVLAARCASVRALDVSQEMLRRARELNQELADVAWLHCDGRRLTGVADASADVFFCHVVFQHVPNPSITYGYIVEVGRILRHGGWAAFQVSDDPAIHLTPPKATSLTHRARALLGRGPKGSTHPAWLGSAIDLDEVRSAAEGCGMTVERIVGRGTQFCYVLLRRADRV
jgi:SAM-dependent methyltransferase